MRHRTAAAPRAERTPIAADDAWWRQPVLWLGAAILLASLAGCIVMLMLAARHADTPLPKAAAEVMRVPVARPVPEPAIEKPR